MRHLKSLLPVVHYDGLVERGDDVSSTNAFNLPDEHLFNIHEQDQGEMEPGEMTYPWSLPGESGKWLTEIVLKQYLVTPQCLGLPAARGNNLWAYHWKTRNSSCRLLASCTASKE